jgi:hypothetical protein
VERLRRAFQPIMARNLIVDAFSDPVTCDQRIKVTWHRRNNPFLSERRGMCQGFCILGLLYSFPVAAEWL